MAKRLALATATILVCGGFAIPIPSGAVTADEACTLTLSDDDFDRAIQTTLDYLERHNSLPADRHASFLAAFPELRDVEADVQRRIRDEELGVYLNDAHFADPTTIEYSYAVEAFAKQGLPEDVAAWYLMRHSPTRVHATPSFDEIQGFHQLNATGGELPLGEDDPEWFAHTGKATDVDGVAEELRAEFPELRAELAQRWATHLVTTGTYDTFRAVDAYADRIDQTKAACEAEQPTLDHAASAATVTATTTEVPDTGASISDKPEPATAAGTDIGPVIAGIVMLLGILGYGAFAYTTFYA